jgi:hypothetical protein
MKAGKLGMICEVSLHILHLDLVDGYYDQTRLLHANELRRTFILASDG